ncbi:hypothetical protein F4777DRAFT_591869 [Nemania sp. FL0916]|nr:hypothetical protein F4777DRAFT_591869 [Nemania sp. FL0916]
MTTPDKSSLGNSCQKPRTRQRIHKEPPSLAVPDINDNATERKRVLNVLAQRRYRERKRQEKGRSRGTAESARQSGAGGDEAGSHIQQDTSVSEPLTLEDEPSSLAYPNIVPTSDSSSASLDFIYNEAIDANILAEIENSRLNMNDFSLPPLQAEESSFEIETTTLGFLGTVDPSTFLNSLSSSPSASHDSEITDMSFPDSYYLPVNELTLLKGFMRIAIRLRCNTTTIWDIGANSPFNDGTHTVQTTQELPQVWRPTLSQSNIPHHPVIDLLPWPNVRDRLIMLMALPEDARPPAAAGPLGIAQLTYDLEDAAEGIRIWGDNPCEPSSWEVGQVLLERWWFVFDRQVIEQSNHWRELRGAAALSAKS